MDCKEFEQFIDKQGFKHFSSEEIGFLGDSHNDKRSRAYAKNNLPRKELWKNIIPVISILNHVREDFNTPVIIISAYRSPEYNKAIGGVRRSQHLYFKAVDFIVVGVCPEEVGSYLKSIRSGGLFKGGIGIYRGLTHLDTRGTNVDWG